MSTELKIQQFINRINKKYSIDVSKDWELLNNPIFCIHVFKNKPRKGDVCGKQIKEGEYCSVHKKKKKEKENENEYVFLNLKLGKYIHKPTRFLFFSKELKVVYAKLSIYEKIIPLCDKDIEMCKKIRFKYDIELYKQCI